MPRARRSVQDAAKVSSRDTSVIGKRKRGTVEAGTLPPDTNPSGIAVNSPTELAQRARKITTPGANKDTKLSIKPETSVTIRETEQEVTDLTVVPVAPPRGAKAKAKATVSASGAAGSESEAEAQQPAHSKRKRKTKEEKEAEAMPLAARTANPKYYVGAHTSIAKGVENAITNAVHIGGNSFACFLKSQRKWDNPALKDENRDAFRKHMITHKYDTKHVVPHGSYLVNLATADKDMAAKSYAAFIDDLHRCEALGISYYNFHPGGAGQSPLQDAISRLADNINRALSETNTVIPLLENMAGHGTLIGGRFTDLRDVIALIKPEFKDRIGVCIDTCHAFAAGYDLRTPASFAKTMAEFDEIVGLKYLKALHLNDSKAPFNSHRDLHQNIGLGFLGLRAFHNVMNFGPFENLPLILETPCEKPDPSDPKGKKTVEDKSVWAQEIKLLESLSGMDPEGTQFKSLEKELSGKGKKERDEMQRKFDVKVEKDKKKLAKEKGQKSLKDMFGKPKGKTTVRKKAKGKESDEEDESELSSSSGGE